jgi:putative spermidine/putrescine transport system permease protein
VATWLVFSYLWLPFMVLPIYAGLERIPNSMLDASGDLGGRPWMTFRRVVMPLALPAVVAGSIFTFSLTLGDYIAPTLVSSTQFIGNVVYANVGVANNLPLASAFATVPVVIMIVYLRIGTVVTLAFIYIPLIVIAIYAFNKSRSQAWPVDGFTFEWFDRALHNPGVRDALWTSIKAALGATAVALLLGTLAAIAVSRYRFFGRETISFLIVLPIALPGIVTGMALNATFTQVLGLDLSLFTVIVGHATFCIVVVFNNAVARLRRSGTSLEEASMDLGANGWHTFRFVTFPTMRTALVAGALLAFALSLDEIIVTTFTIGQDQTLPIWIFANYARPNQLPIVNVVGLMVIVLSIIPVYLANRLSQDPVGVPAGAAAAAVP